MRSKQVTVLLVFVVQSLFHSFNAVAQVAVRGETVYTMAGEPIKDGVVVITDGKIVEVGPASAVQIPDGHRTLTAKVVTPGLVDAHTVVGLTGYMNQDQDQDQLERSGPIHPELRAIDAYNPQERLVQWLREFGITTIHTGHAPGLPLSGQTMIAKTTGETVEEAVRVPTAMLAVTLGRDAAGKTKGKEATPGTRAKVMAVLRAELIKAQDYTRKLETAKEDKKPSRDLRLEMLARVLDGEVRLLITAHKAHDIISALRLAREFDLKIVLDGAAEAYMVLDKIKQAGVPVIIHPTMLRAYGERKNLSMETAAKLKEAGIPFALQSGYESYVPKTRVVLFEAAIAAAYGLSFEDALASITIEAAKILGVDRFVGSLEVGKDGDVALFDGDPFEYTSHVVGVVIEGVVVSEVRR
ncbi:MAG: amidohydrolase family protein [Planctomycetes bacterium]|nr:amidohydrolase family protein [Planctomycetota bacterium]